MNLVEAGLILRRATSICVDAINTTKSDEKC